MSIPASAKYAIIHEMTRRDNNLLTISVLCKTAEVSRSGYYHYLDTEDIREMREAQDRLDFEQILGAYQFKGYKKGCRSIYMRLLHLNPPIHMNIKKICRLMKKYAYAARYEKQIPIVVWLRLWQRAMWRKIY